MYRNEISVRLRSVPIMIAMIGQLLTAQVQEPLNFYTGRLIGRCLLTKCRLFQGSLTTDVKPEEGQPVTIRVTEELFGPGGEEIVTLKYADPNRLAYSNVAGRQAWKVGGGVTFSKNTSVIVAQSLDSFDGFSKEELLLVSSNQDISDIAHRLAIEAKQLNRFTEGVSGAVASLSNTVDGPLAGYLFIYLSEHFGGRSVELKTSLLSQMTKSLSVPPIALGDITTAMAVTYPHLSSLSRAAVVNRFVDLAMQPDSHAKTAGLRGLSHLANHFYDEISAMIPPTTRNRLTVVYGRVTIDKKMPRNESLDKLLGMKTGI